ncbi:MAG: Mrp/NBP35 family ATP-binding protein [Alphaproteobacteria bacterium]|nr:Mrp/NBP35 family ATP-binding protein [Alphaproteobacteria bacterium]
MSDGMIVGMTFSQEEQGTKVNLIVEVEPGKNAELDELKKRIDDAIVSVDGVCASAVIFTAHKGGDHKHEHRSHDRKQAPEKLRFPNIQRIIAVASGKGGVGKSTTAVNLAAAFAQKGLRTGLMDADIYGPSIPRLMGLSGTLSQDDNGLVEPLERDGIKVMSMGFMIDEDQPMIWRGPMVSGAIMQFFKDGDWGDLDVLVVDLPPGTGDAQLTLAQSIPLAGAVIVSTPQDIALLDARKALEMFRKTDVPILGIIENMSYFECPHCREHTNIFGHGGAKAEAEKLKVPFLGEIPLDIEIRQKSDSGAPLTLSAPENTISAIYRAIADKIWTA